MQNLVNLKSIIAGKNMQLGTIEIMGLVGFALLCAVFFYKLYLMFK
ncbi:hypothetical protein [Helicobacter sp. T3_23-1056]